MASEFRGIEVFGRQPRQPGAPRRRATPPEPRRRARRSQQDPPRRRLGIIAAFAGGVTVVLTATGIGVSMVGHFGTGILLAYLATGTSVVALLCGAAAVVTGRGRVFGALAFVLGVLASPPVLTRVLGWFSGLG